MQQHACGWQGMRGGGGSGAAKANESRWLVSIFRLSVMSSHDHVRRFFTHSWKSQSSRFTFFVPRQVLPSALTFLTCATQASLSSQSLLLMQCSPVAAVAATYLHGRHPYGSHRQQLNNMFSACHRRRPHQYKLLERFSDVATAIVWTAMGHTDIETSRYISECRDNDRRKRRHRCRRCNDVAIARVEAQLRAKARTHFHCGTPCSQAHV